MLYPGQIARIILEASYLSETLDCGDSPLLHRGEAPASALTAAPVTPATPPHGADGLVSDKDDVIYTIPGRVDPEDDEALLSDPDDTRGRRVARVGDWRMGVEDVRAERIPLPHPRATQAAREAAVRQKMREREMERAMRLGLSGGAGVGIGMGIGPGAGGGFARLGVPADHHHAPMVVDGAGEAMLPAAFAHFGTGGVLRALRARAELGRSASRPRSRAGHRRRGRRAPRALAHALRVPLSSLSFRMLGAIGQVIARRTIFAEARRMPLPLSEEGTRASGELDAGDVDLTPAPIAALNITMRGLLARAAHNEMAGGGKWVGGEEGIEESSDYSLGSADETVTATTETTLTDHLPRQDGDRDVSTATGGPAWGVRGQEQARDAAVVAAVNKWDEVEATLWSRRTSGSSDAETGTGVEAGAGPRAGAEHASDTRSTRQMTESSIIEDTEPSVDSGSGSGSGQGQGQGLDLAILGGPSAPPPPWLRLCGRTGHWVVLSAARFFGGFLVRVGHGILVIIRGLRALVIHEANFAIAIVLIPAGAVLDLIARYSRCMSLARKRRDAQGKADAEAAETAGADDEEEEDREDDENIYFPLVLDLHPESVGVD